MTGKWGLGLALLAAAAWAQTPAPAPRGHSATAIVQKSGTYLGVGVEDVDAERAEALKLKEARGAEVTSVVPDGPAAKAGLQRGDVVLEYNGTAVQGIEQLQRMVRETPPGRQVKIGLWRNGAPLTLTATVEERKSVTIELPDDWGAVGNMTLPPLPPMPPFDVPRFLTTMQSRMLGIEGEALGQEPQFAEFFGVKDGVLVKSVTHNSAAERAGIKAGDVIVKVGDTPVGSSRDITAALRNYPPKRTFTVTVVRNKKEMPVTVTLDQQTGQNTTSPGDCQADWSRDRKGADLGFPLTDPISCGTDNHPGELNRREQSRAYHPRMSDDRPS
jgi:serine protease Do